MNPNAECNIVLTWFGRLKVLVTGKVTIRAHTAKYIYHEMLALRDDGDE